MKSVKFLQEIGCCPRCVLVHCFVRDTDHYITHDAVVAATQALLAGTLGNGAGGGGGGAGGGDTQLTSCNGKAATTVKSISSDRENSDIFTNRTSESMEIDACEENGLYTSTSVNRRKDDGENDALCIINDVEKRESICISCLGLLQNSCCSHACVEKLCGPTLAAGYDATSFSLSVTLPVCLSVRGHLIAAQHTQHCGATPFGEKRDGAVTLLKDVWKAIVSGTAAAVLQKTCCAGEAVLSVPVYACCEGDAEECHAVMTAVSYTGPQLKKQRNRRQKYYKYKHDYKGKHANQQVTASDAAVIETDAGAVTETAATVETVPEYSRQTVETVLAALSCQQLLQLCPQLPSRHTTGITVTPGTPLRAPVFVAGRYRKYSRQLSQTPWIIQGELKCASSVEELIARQLMPVLGAQELKFLGSGREDVDVRCLGRGRPFALEVQDPRRAALNPTTLLDLQRRINASTADIAVSHLQLVDKEGTGVLRYNTEDKIKSYCALCVVRDGDDMTTEVLQLLHGVTPLTIMQQTPLRVLHRRPLLTRPRVLHTMSAEVVNGRFFKVFVRTEAGTYIKELVHGDFGRTRPSLTALLGRPVDIIALDVMDVELDWPPAVLIAS